MSSGGGAHEDYFMHAEDHYPKIIWERFLKPDPSSKVRNSGELLSALVSGRRMVGQTSVMYVRHFLSTNKEMGACQIDYVASEQKLSYSVGTRKNFRCFYLGLIRDILKIWNGRLLLKLDFKFGILIRIRILHKGCFKQC